MLQVLWVIWVGIILERDHIVVASTAVRLCPMLVLLLLWRILWLICRLNWREVLNWSVGLTVLFKDLNEVSSICFVHEFHVLVLIVFRPFRLIFSKHNFNLFLRLIF